MKIPSYLKPKNTDSLILLLAGLVLIAITTLYIVTNEGISFLQTSNRNSNDAYILKGKVQKLLSDVLYMESAQRGNIINKELNESSELQAMDNVQTDLKELQPLVSEQVSKEYDQLDFFIKRKLKFSDLVLNGYKRGGNQEASAIMDTKIGDQLRDSVYKYATRLETVFNRNAQLNLDENFQRSKKLKPIISILTILSIIVIVLLSVRVVYKINHKNTLIRKLRIAHNKQIKAKKELEAAKREAETLATLKQNFLANMSHEIRTPINAVIGFGNILQKTRLTKEQKKFVKLIQNSGNSLLALVNDILDFSKLEAGMVKIESIGFDLNDLSHSIINMFHAQAKEKGIELSLHLDAQCPALLIGDPLRITQILTNLTGNAIKFTQKGSVALNITVVEKSNDHCTLKFVVRDTGTGMSEQQLAKIFDRFDQGENDVTRKFGGTGLGLAIVKNLIELQGGNIHVESKVEVGTIFSFALAFPIQKELPKDVTTTTTAFAIEKDLKLLVVDDNEVNLMLVEYLLSDWGIYYETALNGAKAIEKLKQTAFDLVLMDVQMPEMDGYTATQFIRNELKSEVTIIAMTAHVLPGEQERCKAHGMDDYISKPLQETTLQQIINKYCGKAVQATQQTETLLIDKAMIRHKFSGNADFIRKIISKALVQFTSEWQQLNEYTIAKDAPAIMEAAHKMRSTVTLLHNNSQLADWLTEIEMGATEVNINWEQIQMLVQKIASSEEQLHYEAQLLLQEEKLTS